MAYIPQLGYIVETTLASAVTNTSTYTSTYPTGTTLVNFDAGLYKEGSGHSIVDGANKYADSSSGITFTTFGASTITYTNNTGATLAAGSVIKTWIPVWASAPEQFIVPITLAGVTAADVVTEIRPGVDGYITDVQFVVTTAVTTAAKAATLNLEIGTTNLTGGTVALTSANCTPLGARVAGSRITAANRITKADKLSVEASAVTAFLEGAGFLLIRFQPDIL